MGLNHTTIFAISIFPTIQFLLYHVFLKVQGCQKESIFLCPPCKSSWMFLMVFTPFISTDGTISRTKRKRCPSLLFQVVFFSLSLSLQKQMLWADWCISVQTVLCLSYVGTSWFIGQNQYYHQSKMCKLHTSFLSACVTLESIICAEFSTALLSDPTEE